MQVQGLLNVIQELVVNVKLGTSISTNDFEEYSAWRAT